MNETVMVSELYFTGIFNSKYPSLPEVVPMPNLGNPICANGIGSLVVLSKTYP